MDRKRIAVLGLFRSGSTAVAGVLDHLGVDMGAPFYGGYYESAWLSDQLRRWWDEPNLRETVAQPERVRVLARWIKEREKAGAKWVGMKHPLLSLCGDDLVQAWGAETCFIRCCRPLEESSESLTKLGYRGDSVVLQQKLMSALDRFFADREHLQIQFSDLMKNPAGEVHRLIGYLRITAEAEKIASAVHFVQPGTRGKVEVERRAARALERRLGPKGLFEALKRGLRQKRPEV
jgi:hypothetical protein